MMESQGQENLDPGGRRQLRTADRHGRASGGALSVVFATATSFRVSLKVYYSLLTGLWSR